MKPKVIFGSKQDEAVESLKAVSRNLVYIRNSITNLSDKGKWLFEYMQLELINTANLIGGHEGAEEVFNSTDICVENTRKKQAL